MFIRGHWWTSYGWNHEQSYSSALDQHQIYQRSCNGWYAPISFLILKFLIGGLITDASASSLANIISSNSSIITLDIFASNPPYALISAPNDFQVSSNKLSRWDCYSTPWRGIRLSNHWCSILKVCYAFYFYFSSYFPLDNPLALHEWVHDCFSENTTLEFYQIPGATSNLEEKWYTRCNRICNSLGVGLEFRNSIPRSMENVEDIKTFVEQLMVNSSEWRAMKLIVLGHGRIGKTTMLSTLRSILNGPQV